MASNAPPIDRLSHADCQATAETVDAWTTQVQELRESSLRLKASVESLSSADRAREFRLVTWSQLLELGSEILSLNHPQHPFTGSGGLSTNGFRAVPWVVDSGRSNLAHASRTLALLRSRAPSGEPEAGDARIADAIAELEELLRSATLLSDEVAFREPVERLRVQLEVISRNFSTDRAVDAAERSIEAAQASAESAGTVAESELAREFADLAATQGKTAMLWQAAAITVTVVTATYIGVVAFGSGANDDVLRRLALAVPVLLLSGICSYEASRYRRVSQWALLVATQLKSLRAISATLDDQAQQDLRLEVGRRALLGEPSAAAEESAPPLTAEAVLRLLADRAAPNPSASRQGGSGA